MIKMAVVDTALPQFKLEDYKEEIWNDWCVAAAILVLSKEFRRRSPTCKSRRIAGDLVGHWLLSQDRALHEHARISYAARACASICDRREIGQSQDDGHRGRRRRRCLWNRRGYFLNTARRNLDLTYIVFDNAVYGLTKGQSSPTLRKGLKTKSMPEPAIQDGVNPIAIALGAGYTWIGRGYALDPVHLAKLIQSAIEHRGTALLDVLQTCPTYNDLYTVEWYAGKGKDPAPGKRLYKLEETGFDPLVHDPSNMDEVVAKKSQALTKSYEWGAHIPIGVFYQINAPTYEDALMERIPALNDHALSEMPLERDVAPLFKALT
jgi:hypothetical protein